ncbi:hypothetical protein A0H76_2583 [Hepatospora eriocheir]|uniref:Uncharacterized protein n=1 Tax=Hepatospora eriocheir TaxID=1081669 RepID=A0A1X0QJL5_9MICR|nr:hypothetical protein A0H76_2583 [Hepatospora eriocheir]
MIIPVFIKNNEDIRYAELCLFDADNEKMLFICNEFDSCVLMVYRNFKLASFDHFKYIFYELRKINKKPYESNNKIKFSYNEFESTQTIELRIELFLSKYIGEFKDYISNKDVIEKFLMKTLQYRNYESKYDNNIKEKKIIVEVEDELKKSNMSELYKIQIEYLYLLSCYFIFFFIIQCILLIKIFFFK